uniref:LAGLIDADG endonuclease n=1 Tax=Orbilia brochopaga TaxID=3140254 RepID=A0A481ZLX1_9PEZI|nr:LAGLIDADG endonuclease [Drechslerella brochopaga]QBL02513.1 LAGLIDADG endonuclease [Drechslerella brochopaga]
MINKTNKNQNLISLLGINKFLFIIAILYLFYILEGDVLDNFGLSSIIPLTFYINDGKLNPWFVTGFSDAECSFIIRIRKNLKYKTDWSIELRFQIGLHKKDKLLLEKLQSYFGVGLIKIQTKDSLQFIVQSIKDLEIIINHFDKYPLITQKSSDYLLFRQAFQLVKNKKHLDKEGIQNLVAIKAVFNKGLPDYLKAAFPEILPYDRPLVYNIIIQDPYWVSGFVSGDGCFNIRFVKNSKSESVNLSFLVTQHDRDAKLLNSLVEYFQCGRYRVRSSRLLHSDYVVTKFDDIKCKIVPFFDKYPLQGEKYLDFLDFKKIMLLKGNSYVSLTKEMLAEIKQIKSGMNKGRK